MDGLQHPIVKGALAGAVAAAAIDFAAFRAWKSWEDAAKYEWATAVFRWAQGAVVGAVTSAGVGAL